MALLRVLGADGRRRLDVGAGAVRSGGRDVLLRRAHRSRISADRTGCLGLPGVRDHVGRFLDQVAAPGSTAGLALLCGLGAMLLGVLLLIGVLGRRKQRLVILDQDDQTGTIAARRRPLGDMARALAEPVARSDERQAPDASRCRGAERGER